MQNFHYPIYLRREGREIKVLGLLMFSEDLGGQPCVMESQKMRPSHEVLPHRADVRQSVRHAALGENVAAAYIYTRTCFELARR